MSEKSKWFDRAEPVSPALAMLSSSGGLLYIDVQEFQVFIEACRTKARLPEDSCRLFLQLCELSPAVRLTRNLRTLLGLLPAQPVRSVIENGLTPAEKYALQDLEHARASPKMRAVAQGLLNVSERQQLADTLWEMYRDERARRWKSGDGS